MYYLHSSLTCLNGVVNTTCGVPFLFCTFVPKQKYQKFSTQKEGMGGEAPLQYLPISVGINPTAEIGIVRHFVGIPKTDKMTSLLSGYPDPWWLISSRFVKC